MSFCSCGYLVNISWRVLANKNLEWKYMCSRKLYKTSLEWKNEEKKKKKPLPEGIESHFRFGVKCWTKKAAHFWPLTEYLPWLQNKYFLLVDFYFFKRILYDFFLFIHSARDCNNADKSRYLGCIKMCGRWMTDGLINFKLY